MMTGGISISSVCRKLCRDIPVVVPLFVLIDLFLRKLFIPPYPGVQIIFSHSGDRRVYIFAVHRNF